MSTPTISAYISAFNVIQNGLDHLTPLRAALAFFDEVVVAVNTSTDNTLMAMQSLADQVEYKGKLKVVTTDLVYTDVTFDGRIKDAALQACTGDILVQLDLDEVVPPNQYDLWRRYAQNLMARDDVDCFLFPTIDLWGSMDTIRADKGIGCKFRMHKRGFHRGVLQEAWMTEGKRFDTSRSDSCELIDSKGHLVRAMHIVPLQWLNPAMTMMLNGFPFSLHLGYVNFDQRIRVNKAIWADHWTLRNGGRDANVATTREALEYPVMKHRLTL